MPTELTDRLIELGARLAALQADVRDCVDVTLSNRDPETTVMLCQHDSRMRMAMTDLAQGIWAMKMVARTPPVTSPGRRSPDLGRPRVSRVRRTPKQS